MPHRGTEGALIFKGSIQTIRPAAVGSLAAVAECELPEGAKHAGSLSTSDCALSVQWQRRRPNQGRSKTAEASRSTKCLESKKAIKWSCTLRFRL